MSFLPLPFLVGAKSEVLQGGEPDGKKQGGGIVISQGPACSSWFSLHRLPLTQGAQPLPSSRSALNSRRGCALLTLIQIFPPVSSAALATKDVPTRLLMHVHLLPGS